MSRLIVVSNRVGPIGDAARAGGLAVALVEALKSSGGIWFGWTGDVIEEADTRLKLESAGPLTLAERFAARAPSQSRIERAVSKYTSVSP